MKIVLASQSPRRRELLSKYLTIDVLKRADIDEVIRPKELPEVATMSLAFQKAHKIAGQLPPDHLVIAADTVVYREGYLEKPVNSDDAVRMLKELSGGWHTVITGVALVVSDSMIKRLFYNETRVHMRRLSDEEIMDYVATGEPMDKAGAYGIQGDGARFVDRIEGDFYSVMGLPLCQTLEMIKQIQEEVDRER